MNHAQRAIRVAYLIPDRYWTSTVTSAIEVFHGLALNGKIVQNKQYDGFEVSLLRCTQEEVSGFSGFEIKTEYYQQNKHFDEGFDAIVVPSVWDLSMENLNECRPALEWLKQQHSRGCIIAGLVTGVFYLAEAGLLDGTDATIHWASINIFKQRYPEIRVKPQLQMIEADRVITTSTTPATFDVALLLIQRFFGDRTAEFASHYFTIKEKEAPLPEFLEPSCHDTLIDAARDHIRVNYSDELSLSGLAALLNVTPRTLSRRFQSSTGMTPIRYLHKQRLDSARRLLQSTDLQIQQIAEQAGFGSATVFCRNFKSEYSQSPREFRNSLKNLSSE